MKKNVKKLVLGRETIRSLRNDQLFAIAGGLTVRSEEGPCPGTGVSTPAHGCETTRGTGSGC